jgi:hypothetical protein
MPQPDLISPTLPASPAQEPGAGQASAPLPESVAEAVLEIAPGTAHGPQRIPRWLERSELFLRVLLRMYIGLAICYLPWSGKLPIFQPESRAFWDQNPLFLQFPTLAIFAANGVVRGLVSGLGFLNLWVAFQDAIRHGTEKQ